jgi:hypothetical protein
MLFASQFVIEVRQSNEKYLDNPWSSAVPHDSNRSSYNLSLDSGAHELAVGSSAMGFGLWNPRSCWLLCLVGWLVATKEEN